MRAYHIFEIYAPIETFGRLDVVVRIGLAHRLVEVLLGEKSRGSKHDARQSLVPMEQLAKVFCCRLGDAIDVFGNGFDLLSQLRGRSSGGRDERVAKDARRAREEK